jgi:pyrimidine-nucleoside phosphorylase
MTYSAYEIIDKKKNGKKLNREEIKWIIDGLVAGTVQDYQMSALLMAMFINGMSKNETAYLTEAMLYSGEVLKFKGKNVIDKHSTGGVGDKTSFILAPIAAAAGVKVPMIAGRGLGFTGGTVDKIEAIKGFKTDLTLKQFAKNLDAKKLVLIGQTKDIAPADRIIYALRDVTATIDSIPLITASIMSKKLAEGANGIVMDIKVGNGAFMSNKSDARKLAKSILSTATNFDKKGIALITNMDEPLGEYIGNSLEIIESIDVLKNKGPKDLTDLSLSLAAHMIHIGGKAKTYTAALKKANQVLENGKALAVFEELLKNQGGDTKVVNDYTRLKVAKHKTVVPAVKSGYIKSFETTAQIGHMCADLGGGRKVRTDKIDFGVGYHMHVKIGSKVKKGEPLLTIYHNANQVDLVAKQITDFQKNIIKVSTTKIKANKTIYETINQSTK